ncbi:LANO_0D05820g1_1 [Lachancea nothofagi CBS 11611]|uniref:Class E vacuolar protein-sorting machinery protein HSE1 n=1 Tax=Lachancea nothofagi CBS 11611 TaxID=1266666 RepID=A0A1G4JGZ9_9SACH|nr:LANO_0D05820g1_1 [Lachancea nothofagi CBS 11611]
MVSESLLRTAVFKATDGKLRADNWQYIIDVCDVVKEDPEDGGRLVIDIVEERLKETDANVILRTLSLVVSLAENCGSRLQQAVSSKKFTKVLMGLIKSTGVHWLVKKEVAKTVAQLSDSFKKDPSLKPMQDLFSDIRAKEPGLLEEQAVPRKTEMSNETKRSEDKELEEALRLSIMEYTKTGGSQHSLESQNKAHVSHAEERGSSTSPGNGQAPSPAVVRKVRALHDLSGRDSEELSFRKGDVITVIEQVYRDWWRGSLRGNVGIFPLNYVTPVAEKTVQEMDHERAQEDAMLAQISRVDKLHQTMRNAGHNFEITQDQEVTDLYSSITPLRPQLTKMIGNCAQKKEEYSSLRRVLADAEASYNQLLNRASHSYALPSIQQARPDYMRGARQPSYTGPLGNHQPQSANSYVHAQPYLTGEGAPDYNQQMQQQQHSIGSPQHPQQRQPSQQHQLQYQGLQQGLLQGSQQGPSAGNNNSTYPTPYPISNQNTGLRKD